MGDGLSPGQGAMASCWGACALAAYVVAAGWPGRLGHRGLVLLALAGVAAVAFGFAVERGMRIADGVGWALAIGGLIGLARRAAHRKSAP